MRSSSVLEVAPARFDFVALDEAAGVLLDALPEDFELRHGATLSAAVADAIPLDEARRAADLAILVQTAPATLARPWRDLETALRSETQGAARQGAIQAAQNLRAVLRGSADDAAFAFDDLGDVLGGDPAPLTYAPGPLADRLIYGEGLTTIAGHGASGKSTLAQAIAVDAMHAGAFVVHLDWEQGKTAAVRKYLQLGASADTLRGSLGYLWQPGAVTAERLHDLTAGRPALVLVDSFSKAAAAAGIGGTDWQGQGTLASDLNAFGVDAEVPVLLIDHLNKTAGKSTKWADGAHGKFDAASAQWNVSVVRPFDEHRKGEVLVTNVKARHGGLDTHARFSLGGDGHDRIELQRVEAGQVPALKIERDVIAFLRGAGEPQSQTAVENAVTGKAIPIREALKRLAKDDESPVTRVGTDARPKYEVRDA